MSNKTTDRNKDTEACSRYISRMRLTGLAPSNLFFSNMEGTSIEIDPISLADELGYPEILKIPDFVSKSIANYMTDNEFDYNKIVNIKKLILSDKLIIDGNLITIIKRFRGLKEISLTEEQHKDIVKWLKDNYTYNIR